MACQTNKQSNNLERFRLIAHLRSYVKEPVQIDETLLQRAVMKLKKLPYEDKDPSQWIVIEMMLKAYRLGHYKFNDLTRDGRKLVRRSKYHRQQQLTKIRIPQAHI